jgi:predicted transcriptional regulator
MGGKKERKINCRVTNDLRKKIESLASETDSSMSDTITALIEDGFESRKYSGLDEISDDLKDIKSSLQEVKKALDSYSPVMRRFDKYLRPMHQGAIPFRYMLLVVAIFALLVALLYWLLAQ